ncbi:hypothetical protein [Paraglaciecola arctica]|uniref:hypothetical protein n=1 Tax=Paraglaciecola arctica TaxID=1128911 RepID=UPI001C065AA0|nr:hypothetical protein [Paraglaciecola arctica]MBU3004744.1 hypothetical protein [Paraglaciecola arctica]
MEDIQKQESEVSELKSNDKSSSLDQVNTWLSIIIKLVGIGVLLASFLVGKSFYQQYAHYGPDCKKQVSSFQGWIDSGDGEKGKIVSVNKSRLQTQNGTTQCYGVFQVKSGEYKKWEGRVTELMDKQIIGLAGVTY